MGVVLVVVIVTGFRPVPASANKSKEELERL